MLKKVSHINSLKGTITIPSDKSISHRAVMFSSIAEGECTVSNFSSGADCHSTLNAVNTEENNNYLFPHYLIPLFPYIKPSGLELRQ